MIVGMCPIADLDGVRGALVMSEVVPRDVGRGRGPVPCGNNEEPARARRRQAVKAAERTWAESPRHTSRR